uniref:Ig-like domain-containing protein n=1 Tax=Anas platyrhynchos platyrhynchos TaxID=8840 RepID=A0A493U2L3_ANAPP
MGACGQSGLMPLLLCSEVCACGELADPVFSPLSSPSPGSLVQAALTQPASKSVNPGDTVQITCSGGSGNYWYGWYQQKTPGTGPVTVIYEDTKRRLGIPSRFSGYLSGSTATLTITGVQAEDEAVYYCGSVDSSAGAGIVTQSNGDMRDRAQLEMEASCSCPPEMIRAMWLRQVPGPFA